MEQNAQENLFKSVRSLFKILKLDKKDISSIYFFAILGGLIALTLPLGIQTIINFVTAGTLSTSIVVLIIIVVLGVFINGLVQVRQMQITEKVKQKIFTRYSLEFANKLPHLNIEKLDKYYLPELVNRYFDAPSLIKSLEKILLDVPAAIIQIVFGLILLSFYHPIFIGFGLFLIVILVAIIKFTSPQGLATSLKASDYKYAIASWLEEMARVIKSFKYSKNTNLHLEKADKLVTGYLDARTSHFKILLTQFWSLITFKIIITAAMLTVGSFLVIDNQINVGQFIAADIVIISIMSSVEKLISSLDKVYDTLTSIQKLSKVIDSDVEVSGTRELPNINKGVDVEFSKVSFGYDDKEVLKNVSFSVKAGQMVCLSGASGSGKSSVLRLLTGAFTNFSGSVLIDNVPIGNYSLKSLRSQTGILLNQQDIFNGTLLENLTMGNTKISIDDVNILSDRLNLKDFIKNYKGGYDAVLDTQGKKLNGNIRQEILLVRALVGRHRLLLLENPFNNLEPKEIMSLTDYLQKENNATIIIISEDETVKKQCDLVINLK
ncbi:MAG: peptidase domain-containing ABC transporter [Chitinophagaceae bacterium]